MRLRTRLPFITLSFLFLFLSAEIFSQVKIGGDPKKAPESSAILELDDLQRGFLLPRLSNEMMLKIAKPADGLLVYNTTERKIFIYSKTFNAWNPLVMPPAALDAETGDHEWRFDTTSARVYLVRGLARGDSIYYDTLTRKFIFADNRFYGNSTIPIDLQFPGKYIYKGSASKLYTDTSTLSFPSLTLANILFEVDNDSFALANPGITFYNGLRVSTQILSTATQRISTARSLNLQLNNSGTDTVNNVTAVVSNNFLDGSGYTSLFHGYQINMAVRSTNDVGTIIGYRSTISKTGTSRVKGNYYGYFGTMNGFNTPESSIDGFAYGIFLGSVTGAAPKRNYAFYSNTGHNRFGDSVLITDQFFNSPRAVFDINSTSAMITPNGTTVQRPTAPVQAMLRFNSSLNNMEFYDGTAWKGLSSDSAEWKFDPGNSRVFLTRGYSNGDSIFYNRTTKQFLFTDKTIYQNSFGTDLNIASFNGKYTFKATASSTDSAGLLNPSSIYAFMEADNGSNVNSRLFTAANTVAVANPKRNTPIDRLVAVSANALNSSTDSVYVVSAVNAISTIGNTGYTGTVYGVNSAVSIRNTSTRPIEQVFGIRSALIRNPAATSQVTGNVYGYFGSINNFNQQVSGSAYGIFVSSIQNVAGPRKNFALYTNQGLNRMGDSTLITDVGATTPRAVLDVNATSAMIVPTGTTAQRPANPVIGMVRYNIDNGGRLETFNGSTWIGTVSGTIAIDVANMLPNSGVTNSFAFSGATVGSAVVISPSVSLPAGVIIAWARVSAANTIEVRFENNATFSVNPPSINFNVKVIQ